LRKSSFGTIKGKGKRIKRMTFHLWQNGRSNRSGWLRRWPSDLVSISAASKESGRNSILRIGLTSQQDEPNKESVLPPGPTARSDDLARLEAVLFLAKEPQSSRKISQLAQLEEGTRVRSLVRQLNQFYDAEGAAFYAVEVAGGFQLRSRGEFGPWLRRLHGWQVEVRLSGPVMETLAVVAYRQPVLRATVEAIRGVQCGEILRQLMDRDLVRIVGRSEDLGRPILYGTTKRFLQVFGLRDLDELPKRDWVSMSEEDNLIAEEEVEVDGSVEGGGLADSDDYSEHNLICGELDQETEEDC
jgi:segregation and condensation protein B